MRFPLHVIAVLVFSTTAFAGIEKVVLDFEDLSNDTDLFGTGYAGLFWEQGIASYEGKNGKWIVPAPESNYPYSGQRNIINAWGCALLGITFPVQVNVVGAYIGAQGDPSSWTIGVRVHGYRDGQEIGVTYWFKGIDSTPDWFAINLRSVDRIAFESIPVDRGGGWFGMDDLTYVVPEPATLLLMSFGLLFCKTRRRGR